MTLLAAALVAILIIAVVAIVSAPLRARSQSPQEPGAALREELEAAKEAKYRELRDLEIDYRTGKLSDEDYAATDRALRAEAIEILHRLDQVDR